MTSVVLPLPTVACGTMPLTALAPGLRAQVVDITVLGSAGERLMEMGLTCGTRIERLNDGGPMRTLRVALRGYVLSLSYAMAYGIAVAPTPP